MKKERRPTPKGRDGGLRAQIGSGVGQPPAGELERRVAAQSVEIVGIFVAAGDRENPGAQNIGQPMDDPLASRSSGITSASPRQGQAAAPLATAA